MDLDKINTIQLKQQAVNYFKFVKQHHHTPLYNSTDLKEKYLYNWFDEFSKKKENLEKYPEIFEILEKCTTVKALYSKENKNDKNTTAYIKFVKENNRLPSYASEDKQEEKLANWKYRAIKNKEIAEILKKEIPDLLEDTTEQELDDYINFVREYGYLPTGHRSSTQEEKKIAKWFSFFKQKTKYKKYKKEAERMQSFLEEFEQKMLDEISESSEEETTRL
jgi:hypothetical protein